MISSALDVPCVIHHNKLFQCAVWLSDVWEDGSCIYFLLSTRLCAKHF